MKKNVVFKIINWVKNIICWLLLACLVVTIVMFVISKINGDVPSAFGFSIYRVSSGSMEPELEVGDVILGKSVKDPMEIKVGDVVTFKGSGELSGMLITHKVIVAPEEVEGEIMLQTKGVANEIADTPINADRVVSVFICRVEILEAFYNFFFSPWGLLTIIALIILIFIDEVIAIIKSITGNTSKAEKKDINDIINRIKIEEENSADSHSDE